MKTKLGQYYTTNADYIIQGLTKYLPSNCFLIDPFAGRNDLLNAASDEFKKCGYDIEPGAFGIVKQDTLLSPPDYSGKWILTNPPYLARNKSSNKIYYDIYGVNDLYKAALKSLDGSEGGIVIVPLNFMCDEDNEFRSWFFNRYTIEEMNIFEEQVFDDTSYTICSLFFFKGKTKKSRSIKVNLFPSNIQTTMTIDRDYGYRLGGEFYNILDIPKSIRCWRHQKGTTTSKLYLRAIDTGTNDGRIKLELRDPYSGTNNDRTFATIATDKNLSTVEQRYICDIFNETLEEYRTKLHSLFLSNYRNSTQSYARKRIGFKVAYKLINLSYSMLMENAA